MRFTGTVATDLATIALFDPAAIESIIRADDFDTEAWDDATEACNMAMFLPGSDCSCVVAIYVDEEPREKAQDNSESATGYLHLPSGALCITGAESIHNPSADEVPSDLADYAPEMGQRFEAAPGWYAVRAFALEHDEGPLNEQVLAMLPQHEQDALKRSDGACLVGCGLLTLGMIALALAIVLKFTVTGFQFWWALVGVLGVWLLYYLWLLISPAQRAAKQASIAYARMYQEYKGEFPELVFELKSIDESDLPSDAKGCTLEL